MILHMLDSYIKTGLLYYYGVDLSFNWMRYRDIPLDLDPVVSMPFKKPAPFVVEFAACLAGIAIISDKEGTTLVGRRSNIECFNRVFRSKTFIHKVRHEWHSMYRGTRIHAPHSDRYIEEIIANPRYAGDALYLEGYYNMCQLSAVQHLVCELCPELRDWDAPPGSPEVVLKPIHGGRRLGGVVWKPDCYLCEEGLEFLGLRTPKGKVDFIR